MPLFVGPATEPNEALPAMGRWSVDDVVGEVDALVSSGVRAVILFGIPDEKDEEGSGAWDDDGVIQRALRELRPRFPELVLLTDVCLCEYTSHGHCGVLHGERGRQRRHARPAHAHRCQPRRGGRRRRLPERHDGRPGRSDSRGPARDADRRLLGEVRLGVLRAVPRGRRLGAVVRRPAWLSDGSRKRPRGAARVRAGRRRGRRRDHGQARAALSRRDPGGARTLRPAAGGVQRLRRVRDGQSGGGAGLARGAAGRAGVADGDQAGAAPTSSSRTGRRTSPRGFE